MKSIFILVLLFLLAGNQSTSANALMRWDFASGNFFHQLELSAGKQFADPEVTIELPINGAESTNTTDGSFILTLSSLLTEAVTVSYTVTGTAASGVDYTIQNDVEIPGGFPSAQLPIRVLDDMILESDETVTVTLTSAITTSGVNIPVVGSETLIITDDDYTITNRLISIGDEVNGEEGVSKGSVRLFLPAGYTAGEDITINYSLTASTTAGTADYVSFGLTAVIPAGSNDVTVSITIIDDMEIESDEFVAIELDNATGSLIYGIGTNRGSTVAIIDNDDRITISQVTHGEEGVKNAGFYLGLPSGIITTEDISINYVLEGLAENGTDYTTLNGTVILPAGSSGVPLDILVTDDQVIETTEDIILDLKSATGVSSGIHFTIVSANNIANILDNDNIVANRVLTVSTVNGAEPNINGSIVFSLPGSYTCSELITITYTITGTAGSDVDYVKLTGTAAILAGQHTSVPVSVTIKDDLIIEGDETVIVTITSGIAKPSLVPFTAGTPSVGTVTIADDDNTDMGITVTATDANAAEPADNGKFTISLPGGKVASVPVTVNYTITGTAKDGTDFTTIPLSIIIPAGSPSVDVPVTVIDDNLIEGDETVTITITGITATLPFIIGTHNNAGIIIDDDDDTDMTVNPDDNDGDASNGINGVDVSEPSTNGGFTIRVAPGKLTSVPITILYTLSGTAVTGEDYETPPAQVVIEAGKGAVDIPLDVIDDLLIEGDETVILTITSVTSTLPFTAVTQTASVNVGDDDLPKVDLVVTKTVVQPGPYTVGQDITYLITVTNNGNIPATEVVVTDSLPAVIHEPPVTTVLKGIVAQHGNILTWTIDQLEIGETLEMTLVCRASDGGTLTNTASAVAKETEGKPTDNNATSTIKVDGDALIIPNVFTPNGDGKNERFDIGGLDKYPSSTLYVYNRWGAMVYQSKDYHNNWTGTGLNAGSYFYTLEVRKANGIRVYKGWVEILR